MCAGRGRVAQWITRLTTDQKIPGSNPGVLAVKHTFRLLHTQGLTDSPPRPVTMQYHAVPRSTMQE